MECRNPSDKVVDKLHETFNEHQMWSTLTVIPGDMSVS